MIYKIVDKNHPWFGSEGVFQGKEMVFGRFKYRLKLVRDDAMDGHEVMANEKQLECQNEY